MSYPRLNSKNNGLDLLFKTVLWRLFCFLSFVATDGKDGNGLKLEKVGPIFSSFDAISTKNTKNGLLWVALFKNISYSPRSLSGSFCAWGQLNNDFSEKIDPKQQNCGNLAPINREAWGLLEIG